jgi:hypothetical protein
VKIYELYDFYKIVLETADELGRLERGEVWEIVRLVMVEGKDKDGESVLNGSRFHRMSNRSAVRDGGKDKDKDKDKDKEKDNSKEIISNNSFSKENTQIIHSQLCPSTNSNLTAS